MSSKFLSLPYHSHFLSKVWRDIQQDTEPSNSMGRRYGISSAKVAFAAVCSGVETATYVARGAAFFAYHSVTKFDLKQAFIDLGCDLYAAGQSFTLSILSIALIALSIFNPKKIYGLIDATPGSSRHFKEAPLAPAINPDLPQNYRNLRRALRTEKRELTKVRGELQKITLQNEQDKQALKESQEVVIQLQKTIENLQSGNGGSSSSESDPFTPILSHLRDLAVASDNEKRSELEAAILGLMRPLLPAGISKSLSESEYEIGFNSLKQAHDVFIEIEKESKPEDQLLFSRAREWMTHLMTIFKGDLLISQEVSEVFFLLANHMKEQALLYQRLTQKLEAQEPNTSPLFDVTDELLSEIATLKDGLKTRPEPFCQTLYLRLEAIESYCKRENSEESPIDSKGELERFLQLCRATSTALMAASELQMSESELSENEGSASGSGMGAWAKDSLLFASAMLGSDSTLIAEKNSLHRLDQKLGRNAKHVKEGPLSHYIEIDASILQELNEVFPEQGENQREFLRTEIGRLLNQVHLIQSGVASYEKSGKYQSISLFDQESLEHNLLSLKIYLNEIYQALKEKKNLEEEKSAYLWLNESCRAKSSLVLRQGAHWNRDETLLEIAKLNAYLSPYVKYWEEGIKGLLNNFKGQNIDALIKALKSRDPADYNQWNTKIDQVGQIVASLLQNAKESTEILAALINLEEEKFVKIEEAPQEPIPQDVKKVSPGLLGGFYATYTENNHPSKVQKYRVVLERNAISYAKFSFCAKLLSLEPGQDKQILINVIKPCIEILDDRDTLKRDLKEILRDIESGQNDPLERLKGLIQRIERDPHREIAFKGSWIEFELKSLGQSLPMSTPLYDKAKKLLEYLAHPEIFDNAREQYQQYFVDTLKEAASDQNYQFIRHVQNLKREMEWLKKADAGEPRRLDELKGRYKAAMKTISQADWAGARIVQLLAYCRWSQVDIMTYEKGVVDLTIEAYEKAAKQADTFAEETWSFDQFPRLLKKGNDEVAQAPAEVKKSTLAKNLGQKLPGALGIKDIASTENTPFRREVMRFAHQNGESREVHILRHARPTGAGAIWRLPARIAYSALQSFAQWAAGYSLERVRTGETVLPDYEAFVDAAAQRDEGIFVTNFQTRVAKGGEIEIEADSVEAETELQQRHGNFFHMVQTFAPQIFRTQFENLGQLYAELCAHFGLAEKLKAEEQLCDLPLALKANQGELDAYRAVFEQLFQKAYDIVLREADSPENFQTADIGSPERQQQLLLVFYSLQRFDMMFRLERITGQRIKFVNDHCKDYLDRAAASAQVKDYLSYLMIVQNRIKALGDQPPDEDVAQIIREEVSEEALQNMFYAVLAPAILVKKQEVIWKHRLEPTCGAIETLNKRFLNAGRGLDLTFEGWSVAGIEFLKKEGQEACPTSATVQTLQELHSIFLYLKTIPDALPWQPLSEVEKIRDDYVDSGQLDRKRIEGQIQADSGRIDYHINGKAIELGGSFRQEIEDAMALGDEAFDRKEILNLLNRYRDFMDPFQKSHRDYIVKLDEQIAAFEDSPSTLKARVCLQAIEKAMPSAASILIGLIRQHYPRLSEDQIYDLLTHLQQGVLAETTTKLSKELGNEKLNFHFLHNQGKRVSLNLSFSGDRIQVDAEGQFKYQCPDGREVPFVLAQITAFTRIFLTPERGGFIKQGHSSWMVSDVLPKEELHRYSEG